MSERTRLQRTADELDLQMYRLADRLSSFSDASMRPESAAKIAELAREIMANRYHVRLLMHPNDREG